MAQGVETAVQTYIRAWTERDPLAREQLLEQCFAADGRFVTRGRVIQGRAALAQEMARIHTDPRLLRIRVLAVDARGTTFRLRAVADLRDGTVSPETLDTGEIDGDGRICQGLTFTGPLVEAAGPQG